MMRPLSAKPFESKVPGASRPMHGIAQAVVHGRVGAVAAQHAQQRAVLLPVSLMISASDLVLLDDVAEGLPVAVREGGIAHHVHAPAAAPWFSQ